MDKNIIMLVAVILFAIVYVTILLVLLRDKRYMSPEDAAAERLLDELKRSNDTSFSLFPFS